MAGFIFISCVVIALLAVRIFSKVRLRDAPAVFGFLSAALLFQMNLWHRGK
jgi:hypothetical protein